ncbi:MAG: YeiH family protein [Brevefilum sp.]
MRERWRIFSHELWSVWPGINLVLGVALVSRYLHGLLSATWFGKVISEILIAILLGLYIRALIGRNEKLAPGINFAMKTILRFGIILLGLRLSLQDIAATGRNGLILIIICLSVALGLALGAQRLFKISPRLAALIGVGTAICGNSAIIATAPVIEADEEEVSFAVATITLFGLLAVLVYPYIGGLLGLSDSYFGLWAGTAVNDTSQVVAVSAMYSDQAQNVATIIKLTRNVLMAPLIFLIGVVYQRAKSQRGDQSDSARPRFSVKKAIPGFVIGFVFMALVRTVGIAVGVLPQHVASPGHLYTAAQWLISADALSKFAILMALSAVGLNTSFSNLKRIGYKPLLVGTIVAVVLSITSLMLILFTPFGG